MWTDDEGDIAVVCGRKPVKVLVVVGGRDTIHLCASHAEEVSRLPNVAPANDETLVMRWA